MRNSQLFVAKLMMFVCLAWVFISAYKIETQLNDEIWRTIGLMNLVFFVLFAFIYGAKKLS